MMKNSEKRDRAWSAYVDVCDAIRKIKKGESFSNYPLLNAVSQLQILLTEGFDMNGQVACEVYRLASEATPEETERQANLYKQACDRGWEPNSVVR